jgi:hypothetical protein
MALDEEDVEEEASNKVLEGRNKDGISHPSSSYVCFSALDLGRPSGISTRPMRTVEAGARRNADRDENPYFRRWSVDKPRRSSRWSFDKPRRSSDKNLFSCLIVDSVKVRFEAPKADFFKMMGDDASMLSRLDRLYHPFAK